MQENINPINNESNNNNEIKQENLIENPNNINQ